MLKRLSPKIDLPEIARITFSHPPKEEPTFSSLFFWTENFKDILM